jgi:hypothetical protein
MIASARAEGNRLSRRVALLPCCRRGVLDALGHLAPTPEEVRALLRPGALAEFEARTSLCKSRVEAHVRLLHRNVKASVGLMQSPRSSSVTASRPWPSIPAVSMSVGTAEWLRALLRTALLPSK